MQIACLPSNQSNTYPEIVNNTPIDAYAVGWVCMRNVYKVHFNWTKCTFYAVAMPKIKKTALPVFFF